MNLPEYRQEPYFPILPWGRHGWLVSYLLCNWFLNAFFISFASCFPTQSNWSPCTRLPRSFLLHKGEEFDKEQFLLSFSLSLVLYTSFATVERTLLGVRAGTREGEVSRKAGRSFSFPGGMAADQKMPACTGLPVGGGGCAEREALLINPWMHCKINALYN